MTATDWTFVNANGQSVRVPDVSITYPGVYIEEIPSGVRSIEGVPTSTTAFVGGTLRGRTDRPPRTVTSIPEFERLFGPLSAKYPLTYAVRSFFDNGGRRAVICRVRGPRRGVAPTDDDISDPSLEGQRRGLWRLDRVKEPIGLVTIPPLGPGQDVGRGTWDAAARWAKRNRAVLIVDPPSTWQRAADVTPAAVDAVITETDDRTNAALFFPRIVVADPLAGNRHIPIAAGGAVCGILARTDLSRGVWRAAAGAEGQLRDAMELTVELTHTDSELLNPRGINTLRTFPGQGHRVWGARTLRGADSMASEWKYIPVRRLALYIEESIDRGTQWAVFEPNDEPLWAELRRHIGNFMHTLFSQGAFQGRAPDEGYVVRCDASTTTQADINDGRVIVLVGFAPARPAEFIILRIAIRAQ
jgi:phage tail sheath protein FI